MSTLKRRQFSLHAFSYVLLNLDTVELIIFHPIFPIFWVFEVITEIEHSSF